MAQDLQRARAVTNADPSNTTLASHAATLQSWLDVAALANKRSCPPYFQQSWLEARGGDVAMQRWLSSSSQLPSPRISIKTDEDAASLVLFRAQVGQLDHRCDPEAEVTATDFVKKERRHRLHMLSIGYNPPWLVAPTARFLHESNLESSFLKFS